MLYVNNLICSIDIYLPCWPPGGGEERGNKKRGSQQENKESARKKHIGRTSIKPAHHTFIIAFIVSGESSSKIRKTKTSTSSADVFSITSDHRSCAGAPASSSLPISCQVSSPTFLFTLHFNYIVVLHTFVLILKLLIIHLNSNKEACVMKLTHASCLPSWVTGLGKWPGSHLFFFFCYEI